MSYSFNPKIDRDFIISMYEDDYGYIAEVFETTLNQLGPDIETAKQHFLAEDLQGLRRQVHKIKPAFGFAGLRETELSCQRFEDVCESAGSIASLSGEFHKLLEEVNAGRQIISEEIEQLKAYRP